MASEDLKGDLVVGAYQKIRISGLTSQPIPEEEELGLSRLEQMAAQFHEKDICTGYNFEDDPDPNTPHGLKRAHTSAYESNLAFWLLTYYGKQISPTLLMEKQKDYSYLSSVTAVVRMTQRPARQPRGSGSTLRWGRWSRFFNPVSQAPLSCDTNTMYIGNIDDFIEHFDSELNTGEDISSYTIEADTGLTIQSDSLSTPDVLYNILADGNNDDTSEPLLQVQIVATSSDTRVFTRVINFQLKARPFN